MSKLYTQETKKTPPPLPSFDIDNALEIRGSIGRGEGGEGEEGRGEGGGLILRLPKPHSQLRALLTRC